MMASNQPYANDYIWPDFPCVTFAVGDLNNGTTAVREAYRSGGNYIVGFRAINRLRSKEFLPRYRARLTTMLIDLREQGDQWPEVTVDLIDRATVGTSMPVSERANRLLRFFTRQTIEVGRAYDVQRSMPLVCAWSESATEGEVGYLIDYLIGQGWLTGAASSNANFGEYRVPSLVKVTVDGHQHVERERTLVQPAQAFVAMWIDDSIKPTYEEAIAPAIRDAGYEPMLISQKEHINKIEDEIIAEIRRSRFVVADFTHNPDKGVRGSVYYEAGFAHGLDLPVIFTCKHDQVDDLHFDTSHYSHITWTSPEDLRNQLTTRILAVIGEGPLRQSPQ